MRNNHLAAKRDVENNEVPGFNDIGQFLPTTGMQTILGQREFHPLFMLESEESRIKERKAQRSELILKLEKPVIHVREGVLEEVEKIQRQREEVVQELDQRKDDIVKHEAEMRYNGFSLESATPQGFVAALKSRLGAIIVFILIELVVFGATYFVLEEIMGTMELIVRVLINGVVFGSIDYVRRRKDFTWRTRFLLLFLLVYSSMLVGPIATQSFQEISIEDINPWAIATNNSQATQQDFSIKDFLVDYHQYLLFVIWTILFVVYVSFSRPKIDTEEEPDEETSHESRVWPLIHAGMSNDIKKLETTAVKLEAKIEKLEWQALENLEELYTKLQALDKEYEELCGEQARLGTKREILLSNLMAALKGYESHYMQQLDKSPKHVLMQPRWPRKEDIKSYYNIKH